MITIQKDKCIGCLACVDKCLCRALVPNAEDGRPEFVLERGCIKCMHCAAACPQNAILFDGESAISNEEIPAIGENFADDLQNFLLERRSYRNFKDTPVPMSEIRHALEVAAWAPSAEKSASGQVLCGKRQGKSAADYGYYHSLPKRNRGTAGNPADPCQWKQHGRGRSADADPGLFQK